MKHKGLNQLLCAATVNGRFRETLLHNPAQALAGGYLNHTFTLTPEEHELVLGINAQGLEDFAAQVHDWISGATGVHAGFHVNGRNGHGRNGKSRWASAVPLAEAPAEFHCATVAIGN
ncbi:MAG: hypothetical protein PVI09_19555 [Anaerolineae bacterium]|jgi:hypothetical protein